MRVKVYERPTPEMRYMNGTLQQSWRIQWRDPDTMGAANPESFEWRDVPTAGPAASFTGKTFGRFTVLGLWAEVARLRCRTRN